MTVDTLKVTYTIQNDGRNVKKLANLIALGQTVGAWEDLSDELKKTAGSFLAEVISVDEGEYSSTVEIAFPINNFGNDLGALLTSVFGKISLAPKIKLEDIEFSEKYIKQFQGPTLGIKGVRRLVHKEQGPLLMSIFKPCLGLSPKELGEMFLTQAEAGMDLVKDDEILYDKDFNHTLKRLEYCLSAKEKAKSNTIYSISLTGTVDQIFERGKELEKNGAECLLFNYISYGLPMLQALREKINIPIMAHPAFAGAMTGNNYSGLSEVLLLGKLPRIAGADLVLFPSPYGSLAWEKTVTKNIQTELTKDLKIKSSFPVPSAGIKPSMIKQILEDFGEDIIINAGTAVWSHDDGGKKGALDFINELESLKTTI